MKGHIKRSRWFAIAMLGGLLMALPTQGASFDCAKAATKVEKLICADAELSRLDEEIAKIYGEVLKKSQDEPLLKKQQRRSLKARNQCKDIACLRDHYRGRLAVLNEANVFKDEERYTLLMSKDDELCNHMLQLFNDDLKRSERPYGWHDTFVSIHEEFKSIPWENARVKSERGGQVRYWDVEGALFDFNNDGVLDFVVLDKSMLSGMRADSIDVFGSDTAKRANELTAKEFYEAKNRIAIAGSAYPLSPPLNGQAKALWLLSPFRYRDISYLYMQSLYDRRKAAEDDFAVIAKYVGGKFVDQDMTGKMEDVCYIKRVVMSHQN